MDREGGWFTTSEGRETEGHRGTRCICVCVCRCLSSNKSEVRARARQQEEEEAAPTHEKKTRHPPLRRAEGTRDPTAKSAFHARHRFTLLSAIGEELTPTAMFVFHACHCFTLLSAIGEELTPTAMFVFRISIQQPSTSW